MQSRDVGCREGLRMRFDVETSKPSIYREDESDKSRRMTGTIKRSVECPKEC